MVEPMQVEVATMVARREKNVVEEYNKSELSMKSERRLPSLIINNC